MTSGRDDRGGGFDGRVVTVDEREPREGAAGGLGTPDQRPFVHRLRVRYSETDQQGLVFNGYYLFYYNVALTELFREIGWTRPEITRLGSDAVTAEATIRFLGGIAYDDLLDVRLPITHLGTTSMIIEPRFVVDGSVRADGSVRHVFVSTESMDTTPIPGVLRRDLAPLCVAPGATGTGSHRPTADEPGEGA